LSPLVQLGRDATEEDYDRVLTAIKTSRKTADPPVREDGSSGLLVLAGAKPNIRRAALPLAPLWPGFAIDTLLYGAVILAAWVIPRAWIRARRSDYGGCTDCGYHCGGLPLCPECGRAVIPTVPLPIWRRRMASASAAFALTVLAVYMLSIAGGVCYKQGWGSGGWYAGVWRGQLGFARTHQPFHFPGLEFGTYDIPLRFDASLTRSPERTECLVPLWMLLVPLSMTALAARGVLSRRVGAS
jgi:hypothetical protein